MTRKAVLDPIYNQYKIQIDTILKLMNHNYHKTSKIIEWLYGGSAESWRKFLRTKKKTATIPPEIEELFKKLKAK